MGVLDELGERHGERFECWSGGRWSLEIQTVQALRAVYSQFTHGA